MRRQSSLALALSVAWAQSACDRWPSQCFSHDDCGTCSSCENGACVDTQGICDLYFPSLYDGEDGWQNTISIQAANPEDTVHASAYLYDADGTLAVPDTDLCPTCTNPVNRVVEPFATQNITPSYVLYGAPQNALFDGTAVIRTDKAIVGVTNTLGPNREAFNIYEAVMPRTDLFFTKVLDGKTTTDGLMLEWINLLQIQNVEVAPVTVTINVNNPDGTPAAPPREQTIAAHGKLEIRPSEITGVRPSSGTITVTAVGGKVAGMMKYQYGSGLETESFALYEANEPTETAYLPHLYDGFGGNRNYISVLNREPRDVEVTVTFYGPLGKGALYQQSLTLAQNEKLDTTPSFMMCGSLGCTDFSGTAVISATGQVYVTTNTISPSAQDPREAFNIHEAATPARTLLFPTIFDGTDGWENVVFIQNTDAAPQRISIRLFESDAGRDVNLPCGIDGGGEACGPVIPAHGQHRFSPQTLAGEPFSGSIIVSTSDDSRSIAGVVRFERSAIGPDDSPIRCMTIYEGISQ